MQSTSYSTSATTTPVSRDASTPWPSVSTRCVGRLNASQVFVVEAGRLHNWRYQACNGPRWHRSSTIASSPGADLLHLLEVGLLVGGQHARRVQLRRAGSDDGPGSAGPGRSSRPAPGRPRPEPPAWLAVKFSSQRCCQPGVATSANQSGSMGWLSRTSTDGRRALEHVQFPGVPGQVRHDWTAVAPVPMSPTRLPASPVIGAPAGDPAGIRPVPPAGMERVPAERGDPADPRQLRHAQRAGPHAPRTGR